MKLPVNHKKTAIYELTVQKDYVHLRRDTIVCPRCKLAQITQPSNHFVGSCAECGNYHNFTNLLPHQLLAYQLSNYVVQTLGGVGSGKTTGNAFKIVNVMMTMPGANILCIAQSREQLQSSARPEFDKHVHPDWVESKSAKKVKFKNGSTILFWESPKASTLRGLNLNVAWIFEASHINVGIFLQLKKRIRPNQAGMTYQKDDKGNFLKDSHGNKIPESGRNQIIIESNPGGGWIRDEILFKSHTIVHSPSVINMDYITDSSAPEVPKGFDTAIDSVSIMTATIDNEKYLGADYIKNLSANSEPWEVRQSLYCDMTLKEGLVYDNFSKNVVEPFALDFANCDIWQVYDPGLHDAAAALWLARDRDSGKVYAFDEMYEKGRVALSGLALQFDRIESHELFPYKKRIIRLADTIIATASRIDLNTEASAWKKYGYNFNKDGTRKPNKSIEQGIQVVYDMFEKGELLVFNSCTNLITELKAYSYEPLVVGAKKAETPVDKDNHLLDCIRYFAMDLKHNFVPRAFEIEKQRERRGKPNPVSPQYWNRSLPNGYKYEKEGEDNEEDDWY